MEFAAKTLRIAFDRFEVDLRSGELLKDGRRVRLQAQPFGLLALLLEHPGEVVTREEICDRLWQADTFVDFDHSVGTAINKIREALGESAEKPRFVETLPRRGYRFIGKVEMRGEVPPMEGKPAPAVTTIVTRVSGQDAIEDPPEVQESRSRPARFVLMMGVLVGILLTAVVAVRLSRVPRAANIQSLAVLPLENLSGTPAKEYLADGMTDELITELARTKGLRVISRTSVMQYKGVHRPVKDVARELGVDGVLEGSVAVEGSRVRVTVQLVQAGSDAHVWAQSYVRDLGDVFLLQQEIAESVAKEVNRAALPSTNPRPRISPEAHDAYLLGRYNWYGNSFETARESFEKAIQLQPDYAAAYSGLADYYIGGAEMGLLVPKDALPKGEAAAQKALRLDDSAAEVHVSMGAAHLFCRWNLGAAEKEIERAMELDPNLAGAQHLYTSVLLALNRRDEAVQSERKYEEMDSLTRPWAVGSVLIDVGQYKDAEAELDRRIPAFPRDTMLHYQLARSYVLQGRERESTEQFAEALHLEGHDDLALQVRAAFATGGARSVWEWRIAQLKQKARTKYVSPMDIGLLYGRLGRDDEAFRWLDKAYDDHVPALVFIQRAEILNRWRGNARYQALVRRIGLPPAF